MRKLMSLLLFAYISTQESMAARIIRLKAERKSKKTEIQSLSREVKKTCRKKRELDKLLRRFGPAEVLVAIAANN